MREVRNICQGLVFFFGAIMYAGSVAAQSFDYVNAFNAKHVIAIQMTPPLVASGDRAVGARFCKPVDEFVCVASEWFNFAVPSGKTPLPTRWKHDGNEYLLVSFEELELLGTRRSVVRIESAQNGRRYRFLYSRRDGLVGFSSEVDGQPVMFVSQRAIGFGAASSHKAR